MAPDFPRLTDNRILVLQPGSLNTKCGLMQHEHLPKSVPTAIAGNDSEKQIHYVAGSHVMDWEALARHWVEICTSDDVGMDLAKNDWCLTLCIPWCWSMEERMKATKVAFEVLNVLGLLLVEQPLAAAYGYNISSGLIIDIGYDSTVITPIVDGLVVGTATKTVQLAGRYIEESLDLLLRNDSVFLESAGGDFLDNPSGYTRAVLSSELVNAVDDDAKDKADINGKPIRASTRLSQCIDVLFDPLSQGKKFLDIPHACRLAVSQACETERHLSLWNNLLLIGGCSSIRGLRQRFESEMQRVISASETSNEMQAKEVGWVGSPNYFSSYNDKPEYAPFLGAVIASKVNASQCI